MLLLILIAIVWLVILQNTVTRLQERIDKLENTDLVPPTKDQKELQPEIPSLPTSSKHFPLPAETLPPVTQQPLEQTVEEPTVQTDFTSQEMPSHKPAVEITAAKLFSWIGGFMLFLGCLFGLKYVVENNLLSPAMRIILSIGVGLILAVCGYHIKNTKYRVLSHTLLGSGIAIIYAAIFCAHVFYEFISLGTAFAFMAITSFSAMGVSLKKDAKYVGYLGAIIAFLTPILLHNGSNAWVAFFLYVFCINAAAAYSAVKKGWNGLFICTLSFTWLSQAAWLFPLADSKLLGIIIFFSLYAVSVAWLARRYKIPSIISYAAGGFLCMGLLLMLPVGAWISSWGFSALSTAIISSLEFLGYVLLVNGLILILAGKEYTAYVFARIAKVLSFLILCVWMFNQAGYLPLWLTLGACMVFAALNSGVELLACHRAKPDLFSVFYPVVSMGGLLILSFITGQTAALDFTCTFALFALLLAGTLLLAILAEILWVSFIALGLLFLFLLFALAVGMGGGTVFVPFILIMGLIPLFLCAGIFFLLREKGHLPGISIMEKSISAVSALTPFILILTVLAQSNLAISIHWIMAANCVVCLLTVLAARLYDNTFTLPAAAAGAGLIQLAAWGRLVDNAHTAGLFAIWSIGLLLLFIAVPFLSKRYFWNKNGAWIASALTGLIACLMGCLLVSKYAAAQLSTGCIPTALLVIYTWLLYKLWNFSDEPKAHQISIGFISGAVLCFLTIIFPLQIRTHWLTVAWAGEAVFLAFLHKTLPYRGWQIVSASLLSIISFWLLLCNDFMPIPQLRIWNWYLWIYGLCAAALFVTASVWEKPSNWRNAFYALFGCVLFWLMNIEIAHWFHTGSYLQFAITGHVAQAVTYTLAWALFAVCTIGIGLRLQKSIISKIGIGIMAIALIKFFLSDIWQLQAIYRILGLFGLAIMLIIASFWYQKKQTIR